MPFSYESHSSAASPHSKHNALHKSVYTKSYFLLIICSKIMNKTVKLIDFVRSVLLGIIQHITLKLFTDAHPDKWMHYKVKTQNSPPPHHHHHHQILPCWCWLPLRTTLSGSTARPTLSINHTKLSLTSGSKVTIRASGRRVGALLYKRMSTSTPEIISTLKI